MSSNALRFPGGEAALRHGFAALERRLPLLVSIVLLLATAWLLARLTWLLLPAPAEAPPIYKTYDDGSRPGAGPAPHTPDIGTLVNQHLFGSASAQPTGNAPETTLALTLNGIAADADQRHSRAIILADGKQQTYGVGAQLPGGAVIKAILADRVLLSLNGRVESLRLPKLTDADAGSPRPVAAISAAPQARMRTPQDAPPPASLAQLRHQVVNHPERLLDVVRAMPVMENGKFSGYRVFPAGNPRLFAQMGLRPGDVVTAVNGISLNSPADGMKILGKLKTSDQISITFTRNGQQHTQVLQMQNPNQ